jgi:hypothetical protein
MVNTSSISSRLTGIPSLVAYSMITQIQGSDRSLYSRTNAIVTLYGLLRAKYKEDTKVSGIIQEIGTDINLLRQQYEGVLDEESFHIEEINSFTQSLDGIYYRLVDVITITKIIDSAGLREMSVPD